MRIQQLIIPVSYLIWGIYTHIPTQIIAKATREVIMQKPSNKILSTTHKEITNTQGNQGCQNCIKTTKQGNQITKTLIYHTIKPEGCQDSYPSSCTYNRTTYKVCRKGVQDQCYNPKSDPDRWALQIKTHRTRSSYKDKALLGISQWKSNPDSSFSVTFDVCKAANYWAATYGCGGISNIHSYIPNHKYLCPPDGCEVSAVKCKWWSCIKWHTQDPKEMDHILFEKNETKADSCGTDNCNLVTLTVKNGSWFLEQKRWERKKWMFGIGIDGKGYDPMSEVEVKIITTTKRPEQKSLFWSYYEEMENINIPEVSRQITNTFVKLAEDIAHTLGVSNCFVCGGTNMGERWPWEAQELNYTKVLEMSNNNNLTYTSGKDGDWTLTSNLVGHVCYLRNKTESCIAVGDLLCTGTWENGKWWSEINETTDMDHHALTNIPGMSYLKDPTNTSLHWLAPDGMYWICGKMAYGQLPENWCGSCVLGIIRPGFFLLPLKTKQILGVPIYDEIGNIRQKREPSAYTQCAGITWQKDEWPPCRIILVYGPATWAEDGMYGYRTPIYMINRIIRLQAVVELITNETVNGLTELAKENVKSRTYIMQNRLALDYLLAKEGGVCGKFNLTNCCIEIDESGKVLKSITDKMIKLAHVPVQTWKGFNLEDVFSGWWPKLPGLQTIIVIAVLLILGCILIPCLIPCLIAMIRRISESTAQLTAKHETMLALWEYKMVPTQEPGSDVE